MIETIVVMLIVVVLLATTAGALSAFKRLKGDSRTKSNLAVLDSVIDEFHTLTGNYPNIYGTPNSYTKSGTSGIPSGGLVNFTSTYNINGISTATTASETYAMTNFLRQVEGFGNIGHSGLINATKSGTDVSNRPAVVLNSVTLADGILAQLSSSAAFAKSLSYKNISKATPLDSAQILDGFGNPLFYCPSTITSTSPDAYRPRFGSCGPGGNYWITVSQLGGTLASVNAYSNQFTNTSVSDNLLSLGGATQP